MVKIKVKVKSHDLMMINVKVRLTPIGVRYGLAQHIEHSDFEWLVLLGRHHLEN